MCGLPGERQIDLEGIVEMSEHIARLGREATGRFPAVVANVSNFVPKPQTPFQWHAMQSREYFPRPMDNCTITSDCAGEIKMSRRGDESFGRRALPRRPPGGRGRGIGLAARRRFDAWAEHLNPDLWWQALADAGVDVEQILHLPCPAGAPLPGTTSASAKAAVPGTGIQGIDKAV